MERERILIDQSSSQEKRGKRLEERENRLDERVKQFEKQLEGKAYIYSWLIHFSLLIVILVLLIYICFNVQ